MRRLLLFDFDGTLYRGDDPFRFYARAIAARMPDSSRGAYLEAVDAHLTGNRRVPAGDHWEALVNLAKPVIESPDLLQEAFLETRGHMMTNACDLEVSPDLVDFLTAIKGHVLLAVASNSPDQVARPLLDKLGLARFFDYIKSEAKKPVGLAPFVSEILGRENIEIPGTVFSVGDNYRNDIAPAMEHGWLTAYISPWDDQPGPSTVVGRQIEDVLPDLLSWALGSRVSDGGY